MDEELFVKTNKRVYEKFSYVYTWRELWPAERVILERFKSKWHHIRMLDLGVGTGRTSYTFAAITKEYVGIDYVPTMIDKCLQVFGESESVHFYVCDARDLSRFQEGSFDFVLFSWNGIDAVSHEGRKKIFREVLRVLDNDGHFYFSTHSLYEFPFPTKLPKFNPLQPLRSAYRWIWAANRAFRLKWIYRRVDVNDIRSRPYAILTPPDHRFQLKAYYIKPDYQVKQLQEAGFKTISVYDKVGQRVDPMKTEEPGYLYFLCKPANK